MLKRGTMLAFATVVAISVVLGWLAAARGTERLDIAVAGIAIIIVLLFWISGARRKR
jgi:hypothetical protein